MCILIALLINNKSANLIIPTAMENQPSQPHNEISADGTLAQNKPIGLGCRIGKQYPAKYYGVS